MVVRTYIIDDNGWNEAELWSQGLGLLSSLDMQLFALSSVRAGLQFVPVEVFLFSALYEQQIND